MQVTAVSALEPDWFHGHNSPPAASRAAIAIARSKALILDLAPRFDLDDIADKRGGPVLSRQ
jgi:hypothetical protein